MLSPCYVESEWCRKEVAEFCKAAERSGGVIVDNNSRIIKIIKKRPITSQDALPPVMRETRGYDFCEYVDETPVELDPGFGPDLSQRYAREILLLASDIASLLQKLDERVAASEGICNRLTVVLPCANVLVKPHLRAFVPQLGGELNREGPIIMAVADEDHRRAGRISRPRGYRALRIRRLGGESLVLPGFSLHRAALLLFLGSFVSKPAFCFRTR